MGKERETEMSQPYDVTIDYDYVPYPEGGNLYICKDIIFVASTFKADTDWCSYFESLEQFCCP